MDSLLQLAERCEAAEGPDRRLDTLIHILLEPDAQHIVGHKPGNFPREAIYGPRSSFWEWADDETKEPPVYALIPEFTASLDAAMTLVPEGWHTFIAAEDRHSGRWRWELRGGPWKAACRAATHALALCAASLRARHSQGSL